MSDADNSEREPKETAPLPLVSSTTRNPPRSQRTEPTVPAGRKPKAAPLPTPPKHPPGASIDRYVIERLLGRGGMAEVYQAHDPKLKRKVALKVLHGDQKFYSAKKLFFEAQATAHFEHPNSVIIYDVGETGDDTYIAMELIRGRRLSEFVRDTTVPLERKLRWLTSIARALAAAHRKGLVHRDVKPANVMIRDADGEAKVLDFGIAREVFPEGELEGDETDRGMMVGTVRYAAPEQIRGEAVDSRADQYSWGITAFQLLTGRMPHLDQDTMAVASRVAFEETPSLRAVAPDLPDQVISTIDRALAMNPADRFPSMDEAADNLEAFAEGPAGAARSSTIPAAPPPVNPNAPNPTPPTTGSRTPPGTSAATEGALDASPAELKKSSRRTWMIAAGALLGAAGFFGFSRLRPKPNEAAPTPPPARVEVSSLKCAPATVTGDPDAELARAFGVSACARLGLELGVAWGDASESASVVNTTVLINQGAESEATVEVRGQKATARGSTPLEAVQKAAAALASSLAGPAMSEQAIKAWGAKDEASAKRVERAWRRRSIALGDDRSLDARALLSTDADSPLAQLLMVMSSSAGKDAVGAAEKAALAQVERLSSARASMLRGLLHAVPTEKNRAESARLLRVAYSESPDDADIAAVFVSFAVQWGLPEAYGALDRLAAQSPTRSLPALGAALSRAPKRDLARIDKYAEKIVDIAPEARASAALIRVKITRGKLAEARAALAFARKMGLDKPPAEPLVYAESALWVALATGEAAEARRISLEIVGDPRAPWQVVGGHGVAASYLMEGHPAQAEAALWESADRHRGTGDEEAAARFAARALSVRRLLKIPPVEAARLDWLRRMAGEGSTLPLPLRAEALVEIALAQLGIDTFRVRTETLKLIEALAAALPEPDAPRRHETLIKTIPLVRALRGDKPAIDRWRETTQAPFASRLRPAFDAALALEATGDLMSALSTYQLSEDPWSLHEGTLERILSNYRLAKLLPRVGQIPEGAARLKAFEEAWRGADSAARSGLDLIR